MPPDTRDAVVDYLTDWAEKTGIPMAKLLKWADVPKGKFHEWRKRYGKANEHNGKVPRDHWLESAERDAIIDYHDKHPLNGYRRITFMMLDEDVVAASPATVYRVLKAAGRLDRWNRKPSAKGTGFDQPKRPHQHWHADITYINVAGTFYYLCLVLDGYSRYIVHWELRESMKETDVEIVLQRARERFPGVTARLITDNGPQFVARDFCNFIRLCGMTHVRTSPYYPQSNGKLERINQTLKVDAIRPNSPGSVEEARRVIESFVDHYNNRRLHSAIGYVTPADKLAGREAEIWALRDQRLEAARARRKQRRETARTAGQAQTSASVTQPQPQSDFR